MYIYIYIYICTHIYIYIYTYIRVGSGLCVSRSRLLELPHVLLATSPLDCYVSALCVRRSACVSSCWLSRLDMAHMRKSSPRIHPCDDTV